jgi:hypothetical protein
MAVGPTLTEATPVQRTVAKFTKDRKVAIEINEKVQQQQNNKCNEANKQTSNLTNKQERK